MDHLAAPTGSTRDSLASTAEADDIARDGWTVVGSSACGARHAEAGQVNQDAFRVAESPVASGRNRFVIVVADGHGAAIHPRAALGAGFAVEAAAAVLGNWLNGADAGAIPAAILARWRAAVRAHIACHPLPPAWRHPDLAYGTTLVAAAGDLRRMAIVQIGDGDVLIGHRDGQIERPLADDTGLTGEQTYSLYQAEALDRFRLYVGAARGAFVAVSTDGVAKSFASRRAFAAAVGELSARASADRSVLPDWLAGRAAASRDDATLCLAIRTSTSVS